MPELSHVDGAGRVNMVDVSGKTKTIRTAVAVGALLIKPAHQQALAHLPKGDALAIAEIAGIMAGKKCADLIPLCHSVVLSKLDVRVTPKDGEILIEATAKTEAETGIEMEAYTAVVIAGVTLIDMLKGVDPDLILTNVKLMEKTGGKTPFRRPNP
jgi:cyclic pyranopterin phosphate synthase